MLEFLESFKISGTLTRWDLVVLVVSVGLLFVIAYVFGRGEKDTRDFFLGARRIPAAVACLSFVATEISAVTIIGVPARAYAEDWRYLQFFIGSSVAKVVVAFLFIPVFFKYNCTSIYEFLRHRFGPATQYAGSVFFFITRLLGSGLRLYAACMAISVILGWKLPQTLLAFTVVTIVFIAFGGVKAVVWNGAYQACVFYLAGAAVVAYLLLHLRGGAESVWRAAADAGRLNVFDFRANLWDPKTFWGANANAFFVGLAIFGADQELVQRLLTVRTRSSSQKAILGTIAFGFPLVCTYLLIGTLLFLFYHQNPQVALPGRSDEVISHFVVKVLPEGIRGLVLAAIILASIDSPLSSLSSSFVSDIYRPLINKSAGERHCLWISRAAVVFFGVVLAVVAYLSKTVDAVLWSALEIMSIPAGSILGVFLLGILTRRRANRGNVVAMVVSALAMTALSLLSKGQAEVQFKIIRLGWDWLILVWAILKPLTNIGWTWLIVFGTISTFLIGLAIGPAMDRPLPEAKR